MPAKMKTNNTICKKYSCLLTALTSFFFCCAQTKEDSTYNRSDNRLFLELGGPGFSLSLNYQHFILRSKTQNTVHWRAGLGVIGPISGRDGGALLLTLPAGLQYRFGKNKKFETGAGVTIFYFTNTGFQGPGIYVSAAYYLTRSIRIMVSPFFGKKSTIKSYFNINQPVLPFAGIDILFNR